MIVDFSFRNFRSFRDDAMLSLHAEHPKSNLLGNITYPLNDGIAVLKSAVIYGANASGKSNVLMAFKALRWLVSESDSFKEDKEIRCFEPYLLSAESLDSPIEFEIEFIIPGDRRYIYAVSFNNQKILTESLDFYPSRLRANIFTRKLGDSWENISFGSHYKGGMKKIPFFDNNLYLSKAGNNAAAPKMIRNVYNYFRNILIFGLNRELPLSDIYKSDGVLELTANFMSRIDTGVSRITREEIDLGQHKFPVEMPQDIKDEILRRHRYNFIFHHDTENGGSTAFEQDQESEGTQQLFKMLPVILSSLKMGSVIIIDELESSFHPHIAELIIKIFNCPDLNINGAQLIFTTHNLELMSPTLMRRDQIWFAKKNGGASKIYSLDEFDKSTVTPSSPYAAWYAEGRFGAIPQVNFQAISEYLLDELDLSKPNVRHEAATDEEE
ncbi:putative abortive phage-resistance protein/transporter [Pseudomonas reidholzensis]|uniref:Putative abortive phage-resistance protein/transporter n=1 Tax=Pseudomonas reidholzensis TaxID=1785162 RepID=A0A383RSI2_9PSED|nr:ATP-binding protein [Pseudomonas reidholzensis]SYX89594.1 putative abortive phage-resistance protein/transporter [Pseudomonas reidholzensis]